MSSLLRFDNVAYQYHYEQEPLLCDVSFDIAQGQRATILASSQSGKSTIAKLVLGLIKPTYGVLYYLDVPYSRYPADKNILFLPNQPLLMDNKSVAYNVSYPLLIRKERADIVRAKTEQILAKYSLDGNVKAGKLNAEERFKVVFARADMRTPKLILVDDVHEHYAEVMDYISNKQCALLLLTSQVDKAIGDVIIFDDKKTSAYMTKEQAKEYVQQHYWVQ